MNFLPEITESMSHAVGVSLPYIVIAIFEVMYGRNRDVKEIKQQFLMGPLVLSGSKPNLN